jgi:epoxyqueuosine reductase QueG
MGSPPSAPDNSAQVAAANAQQADLEKKNKELQAKKEYLQTQATADFNAKRRGQTGRQSLIATSERGVLGSTGKLG